MSPSVRGEPLGQSLAYQGDVPLRWYIPTQPLDAARTLQLQDKNKETLRTFLELGDIRVEVNEEEHDHSSDLARLELKMDLVLKLLSQIYTQDQSLPSVCSLTLGTDYAEWIDVLAPSANQEIHLEVFLDAKYPFPLIFPALVQNVCAQKGHFKITAALEFPGEFVSDSLGKFIFRHHRRCIALSRRQCSLNP